MADQLTQTLLLIVSIVLIAIFLYIADKLIGEKPNKLSMGYFIKACVTAIVIIGIIIAVGIIVGFVDILGIGQITPILGFVLSAYAINMILLSGSSFERATWVGIVTWLLVYVIDYIAVLIFQTQLIQFI